MGQLHDEHYVRSITTMGDSRRVVTNQPIFTVNKIKLLERGATVNSSIFDQLVAHKLVPKIDECLVVEDGVTPEGLRAFATDLLDNDPAMAALRIDGSQRRRILQSFGEIQLAGPLAFKLTVAQSGRPEVFDHSLRVALVALYIAVRSYFLSQKELAQLATAAVFHDLGILHVSPDLLRPGRRLERAERHHLYAHPITAFLMLRDFPEYHPAISRTVLEHHERLDGSGYPRGLKGENICLAAQILMLAEMSNTVFQSVSGAAHSAKFTVLLKLNRKKFNRKLSDQLIALFPEMCADRPQTDREASAYALSGSLASRLSQLVVAFNDWHDTSVSLKAILGPSVDCPVLALLNERIVDLQRVLEETGLDLEHPASLLEHLGDDPEALIELGLLLDETYWQWSEIIHEAHRRIAKLHQAGRSVQPAMLAWLERGERIFQ